MSTEMVKGFNIDFVKREAIITAAVSKQLRDPESEAYKLYSRLIKDIPDLKLKSRTHETPKKYKNGNGSITTRNQFRGLTYDRMDTYIDLLPNTESNKKIKENYGILRKQSKKISKSHYSIVSKWFLTQFPKFKTNPMFYFGYEVAPVDIHSFLEEKSEQPNMDNENTAIISPDSEKIAS